MKLDHSISLITVIFAVIGLIFLSNITIPTQPLITNAAVIGFVVAPTEGIEPQQQGIISSINGFFVKNRLTEEQKSKNLPIYIILNIVFVTLVVMIFNKFKNKR